MKHILVSCAVCLCLPQFVAAAVTINEIAWMGSVTSVNHEWIELYNDSSASVSLDGWQLSDGDGVAIDLTGTIGGGGYAVLERTSDDSAPGTAHQLYSGALKNTGATLRLYRSNGALEDQVSSGENWESLGGDNETKDTAQYTPNGWITASPTPGQANRVNPSVTTSDGDGSGSVSTVVTAKPRSSAERSEPLTLPGNNLSLDIVAPQQVFVNQPVTFSVTPKRVGPTIGRSLKYLWNFGDLYTDTSQKTVHVYAYPGTYVVTVHGAYATQDYVGVHEITVLPVAISLTKNANGDIQINNDSPYTIDLSNYQLAGNKTLVIPDNTQLLSRQTITVPAARLGNTVHGAAVLYDAELVVVAETKVSHSELRDVTASESQVGTAIASLPAPVIQNSVAPEVPPTKPASDNFGFNSTTEPVVAYSDQVTESDAVNDQGASVSEDQSDDFVSWPLLVFIVLLIVGCIVVLIQPLLTENSSNSYDEDDKET